MSYEFIRLDYDDGLALLTFNRPRNLNALNIPMVEELLHAVDAVVEAGARCLLITGAGRGFCTGADLAAVDDGQGPPPDAGRPLEIYFNPLFLKLADLPMPIVTAVNGPAAGAGCSLALCGDIVIASDTAYFLQAFVNIGLVPDMGSTWLLPRLIGKARAQAMMMLGERVTAIQALSWGMVYEVVDAEALPARAQAVAAKLAAGPTLAHRLIRQGIRDGLEESLIESLATERRNQAIAGASADFAEGVAAFIEKRSPVFRGR
ncbi:enoyl-CoA hydratase/isomerase [soil metagenome]